ncbi:MAG: cysteine--tRNA ligase [Treponema sp.]|jgi:cysteinyl-tRNA synthetase|nr:cysteine--tRNA ligase [Treponema sp.]
MFLYNTLGREIQEFTPVTVGKVGFYGCGPTVYNYAHIGNLRAYVTHDILTRTLRYAGYDVKHVMNITDVGHLSGDNDEGDDKMVKSADERGKSVLEVAEFYTAAFFTDIDRLNIRRPDVVCKATEHIEEMIALIKRIEANGFTYFAGGNLYFDITKFPAYGELGRLHLEEQKAGARTGVDENKRNPHDFVLWFTKSKFEHQALVWDSPWGRGYPGWHIECSAMSIKYLGEQFDIHAGGVDHIGIHHTNEIAQSEAATGKRPWVKLWVHNEFLVLDRGKMSKSTGGFITLQTLVDAGYDPLDYRYFLLSGHYRTQLQFSYEALNGAKNARKSIADRIRVLADKAADIPERVSDEKAAAYLAAFKSAIENDLATPRALAELWGLLKDNSVPEAEALAAAFSMDEALGLRLKDAAKKEEISSEIERLIAERTAAKKAKDFVKADKIRNDLKAQGVILEDTPNGVVWRKIG